MRNNESKTNNKNTTISASKWSVALACISLSIIVLLLLIIILITSLAHAPADIRLLAEWTFGLTTLIGLPVILVASLIGLILGIVACRKNLHKIGTVGIILNFLLLYLALLAVAVIITSVNKK